VVRGGSVGVPTDYNLDDRGSISSGARDCSLSHSVPTGSGVHLSSCPVGTGPLPSRLKLPGREADLSSPSGAEVKNGGAILPLIHTSSWRGA
jgi:hypothetical protein